MRQLQNMLCAPSYRGNASFNIASDLVAKYTDYDNSLDFVDCAADKSFYEQTTGKFFEGRDISTDGIHMSRFLTCSKRVMVRKIRLIELGEA